MEALLKALCGALLFVLVVAGTVKVLDTLFPPKTVYVKLCLDPVGDPGYCVRHGYTER